MTVTSHGFSNGGVVDGRDVDRLAGPDPYRQPRSPGPRAGARPRPIVPTSLAEAGELADAIVASRLVPEGLATREACLVAILHGLELGLTPLAAVQRIAVIDGRPTLWGDAALALVRASGLLARIDERHAGAGPDDWVATCSVRRRGERTAVRRAFSAADARRAGLWGRPGPWSAYPQRMLQMRARAFALRDAFPDVLGGLYLREEMEGVGASPDAHDTATCASPVAARVSSNGSEHAPAAGVEPERERAQPASPQAQPDATADPGEPAVPPPAQRLAAPPMTPREAWAMRYRNGWSVRQPRTPAPARRTALRAPPPPEPPSAPPPSPIAAPVPGPNPSDDERPDAVAPDGEDAGDPRQSNERAVTADDTLLGDYDAALSCARDRASFDEIAEEFAPRLDALAGEAATAAHRIRQRHVLRVAAIDRPGAPEARP